MDLIFILRQIGKGYVVVVGDHRIYIFSVNSGWNMEKREK